MVISCKNLINFWAFYQCGMINCSCSCGFYGPDLFLVKRYFKVLIFTLFFGDLIDHVSWFCCLCFADLFNFICPFHGFLDLVNLCYIKFKTWGESGFYP